MRKGGRASGADGRKERRREKERERKREKGTRETLIICSFYLSRHFGSLPAGKGAAFFSSLFQVTFHILYLGSHSDIVHTPP